MSGKRLSQILQFEKVLTLSRKLYQALGQGKLVRGDILAKEDDGSPAVFEGSLSFEELCHFKSR